MVDLNEDQKRIVAHDEGSCIVCAGAGCLAGDTIIGVNRGGKSFDIEIERLVYMQNGGSCKKNSKQTWDFSIPTKVRFRDSGGYIRLGYLVDAYFSGKKRTWEITVESGKKIRATAEHRFLTLSGWKCVDELSIGLPIYIGSKNKAKGGSSKKKLYKTESNMQYHPFAASRGIRASKHPKQRYSVPVHRLVFEANLSDLLYAEFVLCVKNGNTNGLHFIDPSKFTVHHLDENPENNHLSNLSMLPRDEHYKQHGKEGGWKHATAKVSLENITSIKKCNIEATYDLSMDYPHNFLANDFIVHNSGKTRVVVERMARMQGEGVDMRRVLATTFTKKGAGVMNDRLAEMDVHGCRVGTFHSVCYEIIKDDSPEADFKVDDKNKMHYVLKDILGYRDMNWQDADITGIEQYIGACKNGLIKPENATPPKGQLSPRWVTAYRKYEMHRQDLGLLTFDDMLCQAVWYLQGDRDARGRWSGKYDHVIVDEFQDTNKAQYELMKILSANSKTLMACGDLDQCIFEWRGSIPEYTLKFEERFDARTYLMPTNYRSRPEILEVANRIIKYNMDRIEKDNIPIRDPGGTVTFEQHANMDAEAQAVAQHILELHEDGIKWQDCAVLYRVNAQSRAFEEVFIKEKIPYIVVGGTEFYKRKEVADILAYLRVAADNSDDESCKRAINRPFRYIGKVSIEKMEQCDGSLLDVARRCRHYDLGLRSRQLDSIDTFVNLIDNLRDDIEPKSTEQSVLPLALSNLLQDSGYEEWIIRDEGTDTPDNSRLSNLRELVRTSGRFKTAKEMLDYIDGMLKEKRKRKKGEKSADLVQVSTYFKAKGLEFPVVFLVGCCEGILPHARATVIEEERRGFFVGVTRAEDRLFVSAPKYAMIHGKQVEMEVSRFVREAGLIGGV